MENCVFRRIGLPTSLKELGVTDDRSVEMAAKRVDRGNFARLDAAEVQKVLCPREVRRGSRTAPLLARDGWFFRFQSPPPIAKYASTGVAS